MINKNFLSDQMEHILKEQKCSFVESFKALGADTSFNPIVILYQKNGDSISVKVPSGDKDTYNRSVRKLIKKFKAYAAIVVTDTFLWKNEKLKEKYESILVVVESKNNNIHGMYISQPYTRDGGQIVFKEPKYGTGFEHNSKDFGNFFKKYNL